jgi:hypothetical protein
MICNSEKLDSNAKYDNRSKQVSPDETRRERDHYQQPNTRFGSHGNIKAPVASILLSGSPSSATQSTAMVETSYQSGGEIHKD